MECKLCGHISPNKTGFAIHLRKTHNISRNDHYLKYEKIKYCKECEKILTVDQMIFCSQRCSALCHVELAKNACRGDNHWLRNLDNEKYLKSEKKRRNAISKTTRKKVKNGTFQSFDPKVKEKIKKTIKQGFKKKKYKRCTKEFADNARIRELKRAELGQHTFQLKAKQIKKKRETTLLKKYGFNNPGKIKQFIEKRSGVNHPNWKGGKSNFYGKDWKDIKNCILYRDNHTCIICNAKKQLIVHHIIPVSSGIDSHFINEPFNLITLCRSCHSKHEWTNCFEKKIIEYLNNWGAIIFKNKEGMI